MPQSRTNFDEALKETYGVGLRNAINSITIILEETQRRSDRQSFQGREAVWSVHTRRSNSTGNRAELGTLPTADRQGYERAKEVVKTIVHTIKLSREVISSSRSNMGAFIAAMEAESRGAERDLTLDIGRQLYGQGRQQADATGTLRTGVIANINGAPAADVITLDNEEAGVAKDLTDSEMRYFFVGMPVDAIDPADGSVNAAAMEIVGIDFDARTIEVDDATGATDNDWIVRAGNYNEEFPGLRVIVADNEIDETDGTNAVGVHNINSGTVPLWQSVKVGDSTTGISELLFERAFDKVVTDGSGIEPRMIVGSYEQRQVLANTLQAQKRYEGREKTLTSGWLGLNVARGTYVADRFCPVDDAFLINWDELVWFVLEDFQWDEEDGRVLFKTADQLAYEARYFGMVALAGANRNSHCRIKMALPA